MGLRFSDMLFHRSLISFLFWACACSGVKGKRELPAAIRSSSTCDDLPDEILRNQQMYHGDAACDRAEYNRLKRTMQRSKTIYKLKQTGIDLVPDAKTVNCPTDQNGSIKPDKLLYGLDTTWIVENTASAPVVLARVGDDGIEYSALDGSITPPQDDPNNILMPGQWQAVNTHEGHVFHVRQLRDDGAPGDLLLQHRVGLIPIGANRQDLICDEADPEAKRHSPETRHIKTDPEPMFNNTRNPSAQQKPPVDRKSMVVRDPAFQRAATGSLTRPCNSIDIGFRNKANCPLHGYWVNKKLDGSGSCTELFHFHLGKDPEPENFFRSWQSPTKFEQSYIGTTFSFRSSADPDILVATYTVRPTTVTDCPDGKTKTKIAVHSDRLLVPVGRMDHLPGSLLSDNYTNATDIFAMRPANRTRRRRGRQQNVWTAQIAEIASVQL